MTLADTQLQSFERDGFLVLPGFVDPGFCAELREHGLTLARSNDHTTVASGFDTVEAQHAQNEYFLTSGDKVRFFFENGAVDAQGDLQLPPEVAYNKLAHAMHDLDPLFDRFSRQPGLSDIATSLGVANPLLLQSMYIFKAPRVGGVVSTHTDHTFLWTDPQSALGFWFAIDDATVDNGAMWALPGGHKAPVRRRFRRKGTGTVMESITEEDYPTEGYVPLEAERGTLIVLHGNLPHRSPHNHSDAPRHAYTLHVIDAEAHYPDDNWLQRSPDMPLRGF
jgi:phytanoyl-CoA hydroxylase